MTSGLDIRLLTSLFPPQRHASLVCHPGWVRTGTPGGWTWKGHTATGQLLVQLWKAKVKSRTEASTRHQFTGRSQTQVSASFFFHIPEAGVESGLTCCVYCSAESGMEQKGSELSGRNHICQRHLQLYSSCVALSSVLPGSPLLIFSDNIQGRHPGSSKSISESRFPPGEEENESFYSPGGRSLRPSGCLHLDVRGRGRLFAYTRCVIVCLSIKARFSLFKSALLLLLRARPKRTRPIAVPFVIPFLRRAAQDHVKKYWTLHSTRAVFHRNLADTQWNRKSMHTSNNPNLTWRNVNTFQYGFIK